MNRDKHLFMFTGKQISKAASAEAGYHTSRLEFWRVEHKKAVAKAKAAGLEVTEYPVTGGVHAQMIIDPVLQDRIQVCANKIQKHLRAADELQIESGCYGTQGDRTFELHPDDVIHFRLAGGPRED